MKTWTLFSDFLCFLVIHNFCEAQITRRDAIDIVTNQLLINDLGKVKLYASYEVRTGSNGLPLLTSDTIALPFQSNWVFFVDDHPLARWCHPCRYIFIDANTGEDTIITSIHIYPAHLSQEFELLAHFPPPDPCDPIYPQPLSVTINGAPQNDHLYAVIIAGFEDDTADRPTQSWNDISAVYTTLKQVYGYKPQNIFVHYWNGTSTRGRDLDGGDPSFDIDFASYKDTINHTFKCLAGAESDPLIPKLSPEDQLFVHVDDHGDGNQYYSWILLPPDPNVPPPDPFRNLYDTTFARWVRNINCGQMIFLFEQCYSGGFLNDLIPQNIDKCKNRSIYTSAANNEKEYMDYHISDQQFGEFIFYWTAAIRGFFPDITGDEPWSTGFPVYDPINYPQFPYKDCFYSTCGAHPYYNPDSNSDGIVTMEEAFYFANDYDSWSDTLFLCPDSSAISSRTHPKRYKNISFQEDLQGLSGLQGNITHSQTVENRSYLVGGPLTITGNSVLSFSNSGTDTAKVTFISEAGKLQVLDGSTLNPGNGMIFNGKSNNKLEIYGNIGGINDVKFKTFSDNDYFSGLFLYNHDLNTALSHVSFINSGLYNAGASFSIKNNSFFLNCRQLTSNFGNVSIKNSVFNGTSIYLNNVFYPQYSSLTDSVCNNSISAYSDHDAVNISNSDHLLVQDNTIVTNSGYHNGIGLFYSGHGTSGSTRINNNTISDCYTGLMCYNSNAIIKDNHIFNNVFGIKSVNYSSLKIIGEPFYNAGDITQAVYNNSGYEIYSYFDFPFLRYNKIHDDFDQTGCLIYVDDGGSEYIPNQVTFDVRYNCWKNNSVPAQLCSVLGSNATWEYLPVFCYAAPTPEPNEDPEESMYMTGDSLFQAESYSAAKTTFLELIEQYPQSGYSRAAMEDMLGLEQYCTNDYVALQSYFLSNDTVTNDSLLARLGEFLANRCNIQLNEYENAIEWYENRINNPEFTEDSICAIIDLAAILLQQSSQAISDNSLSESVSALLSSTDRYRSYRDSLLTLFPLARSSKRVIPHTEILSESALVNRPNPFTDYTEIQYILPPGFKEASLMVSNCFGRIVESVRLPLDKAGLNIYKFCPVNLPGGIYLYFLTVNGHLIETNRMVRIKR